MKIRIVWIAVMLCVIISQLILFSDYRYNELFGDKRFFIYKCFWNLKGKFGDWIHLQ